MFRLSLIVLLAFNGALFQSGARVGDAVLAAGKAATDRDVLKTWVFLGDPSMRLR